MMCHIIIREVLTTDIQDVRRRAEMPEIGDHFFGVLKQLVIGE